MRQRFDNDALAGVFHYPPDALRNPPRVPDLFSMSVDDLLTLAGQAIDAGDRESGAIYRSAADLIASRASDCLL